jgi:hypothetical protein
MDFWCRRIPVTVSRTGAKSNLDSTFDGKTVEKPEAHVYISEQQMPVFWTISPKGI